MNMLRHIYAPISVILLLSASAVGAADTDVKLKRNPFERPAPDTADVSPPGGGSKAVENPGLRAVLFAGPKSVVNFGGVILQIGESSNGYQLLSVQEGAATFRTKGKTIVFSLYESDRGSE